MSNMMGGFDPSMLNMESNGIVDYNQLNMNMNMDNSNTNMYQMNNGKN
jgi:hypothetical protein